MQIMFNRLTTLISTLDRSSQLFCRKIFSLSMRCLLPIQCFCNDKIDNWLFKSCQINGKKEEWKNDRKK